MDFIKKMKKREFIEMALKTLASFFAVLLAFLLLEGMIYGIKLNLLYENAGEPSAVQSVTTAYCIEQKDGSYLALIHREDVNLWTSQITTKENCTKSYLTAREVVFDAPSAFVFSVEGWHFAVLAGLVVAVLGFFTYRFVRLGMSYKKIEEQYLKDGTIEITNVA